MTDARKEDGRASSQGAPDAGETPPTKPRWDPLASIRMTISPTYRAELLMMKRPLLPPEDFMDTADFALERMARRRRFLPALFVLGAVILIALAGWALWAWSQNPAAPVESTGLKTTHTTQPAVPAPEPIRNASSTPLPVRPTAAAASPSLQRATAPEPPHQPAQGPAIPLETSKRPVPQKNPDVPPAKPATPAPPESAPSDTYWAKPR